MMMAGIGNQMPANSQDVGAVPSSEQSGPLVSEGSESTPHPKAWLVSKPGSPVRVSCLVAAGQTRIGRAPDNHLVLQGPHSSTVSLHHAVVERILDEGRPAFRLRDLDSTNGTFVNGVRVSESAIDAEASFQLGAEGPELSLVFHEPPSSEFDRTTVITTEGLSPLVAALGNPNNTYDKLLVEGVKRVRRARAYGLTGQTMTIMRETLDRALHRSSKRLRRVIVVLAVGLVAVSGYAAWRIAGLNQQKHAIDKHISELEAQVRSAASADEANRLITQLDTYEAKGAQLQRDLLYRLGRRDQEPLSVEVASLMAEFGADVYSVPPEFTERVKFYIHQYQGPDRPLIERALGSSANQIASMRQVFEQQHLPPDLSYVPIVESQLLPPSHSPAGAVGLWQFTAVTARQYGLHVDDRVDDRIDTVKSTQAACRYLRTLILDFGSGSSVMLALAAYNLGPSRVKQAIAKVVNDPIKQRNFWYLYRVRALPEETREYVPKVIAAMIIARNARQFGFAPPA